MYLQKVISSKTKIAGSGSDFGSGSICQRHGSADPDPHQNVMDPQHWKNINFIGDHSQNASKYRTVVPTGTVLTCYFFPHMFLISRRKIETVVKFDPWSYKA
jgi:hypothetical protein